MDDIINKLEKWNKAYRNGHPLVPDSLYDSLLEEVPEDHPYRNKPEPEQLYKGHIRHRKPLLSMQKAKTNEEVNKWLDKVQEAGFIYGIKEDDIRICINSKLDGIACVLDNGIFATRGNGVEGNNVSSIIDKGVKLILPEDDYKAKKLTEFSGIILGELVVNLKYFNDNLSIEFSNARNFVSGAVMADTLNNSTKKAFKDGAIAFQSYAMLDSFNYNIVDTRLNFRASEKEIWNNNDYLIDGVILTVLNKEIQEEMGETTHHPNYSLALKPQDEVYTSKVVNIHWNPGRTGKVTPRVELEPVDIDGTIVTFATGHNARMILDMGVKIGVTVEIIRSGSVIPYVVKVIK